MSATFPKTVVLSLMLILLESGLHAQVNVRGAIRFASDSTSVSFANVDLTDLQDSSRIRSTLTDLKGEYHFANVAFGKYVLSVSYLGCDPVSDTLLVYMPPTGNEIVRNYPLGMSEEEIDAVVVTHNNIQQHIDRTEYTITRSDVRTSVHALDLVKIVPQLRIDMVNHRVVTPKGEVKILINGANASEEELRALDADMVKSIEYFDFPPARFSGYGAVMNVKTKRAEDGFAGGIDLQHAVTTGFANDDLFLRYNKGRNQLSLNYNLNFRNYKNVELESVYEYTLSNIDYQRAKTIKRPFGYADNYLNIAYINQKENDYLFQVNFDPNLLKSHDQQNFKVVNTVDGIQTDRYGHSTNNILQFTPSLDLYFWKKLPACQEVVANLVGTYHDIRQAYTNREFLLSTDQPVIDDHQNIDNNKYSVIGEAQYIKNYKGGAFVVGNRYSWENLTSAIDNAINPSGTYSTTVHSDYLYAEVSGKLRKWLYRLSLGGLYQRTESNFEVDNTWIFRPLITVGYQFTNSLLLKGVFTQSNLKPTLTQLSNSASYVDENIISKGNPYLKSGFKNATSLGIYYNTTILSFSLAGEYQYSKNPINTYFVEEPPYMLLTYENARHSAAYGLEYTIRINPFKNNLIVLNIIGSVVKTEIDSPLAGTYAYVSAPFNYGIEFNYKDFSAFYQGNIVFNDLEGPYLRSAEKVSDIGVRYRHKNWTATISCFFFLTDAKYYSRTIPSCTVNYRSVNNIKDNASMITLGLSYRFSTSKNMPDYDKRLQNEDSGLN